MCRAALVSRRDCEPASGLAGRRLLRRKNVINRGIGLVAENTTRLGLTLQLLTDALKQLDDISFFDFVFHGEVCSSKG